MNYEYAPNKLKRLNVNELYLTMFNITFPLIIRKYYLTPDSFIAFIHDLLILG